MDEEYCDDDREYIRVRKTDVAGTGLPKGIMEDTTSQMPENQGGMWTIEEEQALLDELASPLTIDSIAAKHGRTTGAIHARQNHIARRLVMDEGVSIEEAARRVRNYPSSIQQSLNAAQKALANAEQRRGAGVKKEESLLSVMVEVRELLKQMVANQVKLMKSME